MLSNRIAYLAAPPRPVPTPVLCATLFGGSIGFIGAAFLILGMVFVWIFAGGFAPIDEWRLSRSATAGRATITDVSATGATENDMPVYRYDFAFTTDDERTIQARSYSTGQTWDVGERVTVWYLPDDPSVARLEETRNSLFGPFILFVFVFPLIGAGMLAAATIGGLRRVNLLRWGEVADARAISTRMTGTRINNQPLMEYSYEFQAWDGNTYSGASRALPSGQIGDETLEPVLYLPSNPRLSMLVDTLPLSYSLDVDGAGQWLSHEGILPVVWYVLIWATVLASVACGLLRFFGML